MKTHKFYNTDGDVVLVRPWGLKGKWSVTGNIAGPMSLWVRPSEKAALRTACEIMNLHKGRAPFRAC